MTHYVWALHINYQSWLNLLNHLRICFYSSFILWRKRINQPSMQGCWTAVRFCTTTQFSGNSHQIVAKSASCGVLISYKRIQKQRICCNFHLKARQHLQIVCSRTIEERIFVLSSPLLNGLYWVSGAVKSEAEYLGTDECFEVIVSS